MRNYSVLMAVYHKEEPEYLRQAIESIQVQTVPTNDFVLVCDGPLNPELDAVIATKKQEMGNTLNVVRLAKNCGLGNALNEGIKHCKNELVARMDSDDIAYPDRCEKQIAVFNTHSEVSICSGIVEEFTTDPHTVDTRRVPPETNAEIVEFAKKRNPFNHPCVMYKKSAVEAVGSYQDFYLLEDYYLWLRMLMAGYQGYNIQEPLLHMRAGSDMYSPNAKHTFMKVCDLDTVKIENGVKCKQGEELGIDIDVFPIDGLYEDDQRYSAAYNAKKKLYHKYQVIGLQLYTADLHFDLRSVLKLIKRASTIAYGKVCNTFFRSWKKEWLLEQMHLKETEVNYESARVVGSNCSKDDIFDDRYPKECYASQVPVEFEGYLLSAPVGYDMILTKQYGDYMTPPPTSKQIAHHGNKVYAKITEEH